MQRLTRRLGLLGAAGALSGCGFRPLYAPGAAGDASVSSELAAIYVALQPERSGQVFRQQLQQRFEGAGTGVAKKYELVASMGVSGEGLGVQRDNSTTRIRLSAVGDWTLRLLNLEHTVLSKGTTRVVDGYNIINTQYFAADLESDTVFRRLATTLADQVAIQVGTYLKRRAAERPA